jgi:hypothetical protein
MPALGERWVGRQDQPPTFNGNPVHARACDDLAQAWLYATSPQMFEDANFPAFERLRKQARRTVYGAECMAYGLLANGTVDLVCEGTMKLYDYAAVVPIVEGAGGSNAYSSGTIYLEVSKVGNVYTSAYSSNGINWTTLGSETNTTAYTEIGLFTLRQPWDGVALDSVASFDSFNVTSAVPEPSTWAMMILGLCGLGLLAARRRQPIGIAAD